MSTHEHSRRAHELVDAIKDGYTPDRADVDFLRSFLPELPKQKTLEEIVEHVRNALMGTSGNEWAGNRHGMDIPIENWLNELHEQLKGLIDTPVTVPALPEGIRLADHEQYGRVVTSPKPNRDGIYDLLVPKSKFETGADWEYAHECELTFIDAEPAKPAHPEFLETEADYTDVPEGTILTMDGLDTAWVKKFDGWVSTGVSRERTSKELGYTRRRVLRWSWGK